MTSHPVRELFQPPLEVHIAKVKGPATAVHHGGPALVSNLVMRAGPVRRQKLQNSKGYAESPEFSPAGEKSVAGKLDP